MNEKFKKQFYFSTFILPDYVSHESSKEFWKNSHFENMRAYVVLCNKLTKNLERYLALN